MNKSKVEQYEHYIFLLNVDESILKLNPILLEHNFEIIEVTLDVLEDNFFQLFRPDKFEHKKLSTVGGMNDNPKTTTVSYEFYRLWLRSEYYSYSMMNQTSVFLIKDKIVNEVNNVRIDDFWHKIEQVLQLSNDGGIKAHKLFTIEVNTRSIIQMSGYRHKRPLIHDEKYELEEASIPEVRKMLNSELPQHELTDLIKKLYFQSYSQDLTQINLILLITALESVFNLGRDQISHTLSRHAAILVSNSETEFKEIYMFLKDMYNLRSGFVHGSSNKNPTKEQIRRLKKTVRLVILKTTDFIESNNLNEDKKEKQKKSLFYYLNSIGYKAI